LGERAALGGRAQPARLLRGRLVRDLRQLRRQRGGLVALAASAVSCACRPG